MGQKLLGLLKGFFKGRTVKFYIAFGTACFAALTAIIYAATLGSLTGYISWTAFVLLLLGGIAFAALALFRMPRLGSAVLALLSLIAFLLYAGAIYKWPVDQAMNTEIPKMGAIIFDAVLMLICIIMANVCAWMRLNKETEAAAQLKEEQA